MGQPITKAAKAAVQAASGAANAAVEAAHGAAKGAKIAATGVAGGVVIAAAGLYAGAAIAVAGGAAKAGEGKGDKLLKMKAGVEDPIVAICAVISSWVYRHGSQVVIIKDKFGNGAAAYRTVLDFDAREDGYIPDGTRVVKIEDGKDAKGVEYCKVRHLGIAVYVKKHHCIDTDKPNTHSCEHEIEHLLNEHGLSGGVEVKRAKFLAAGVLSPSVATVLLDFKPQGKFKPPDRVRRDGGRPAGPASTVGGKTEKIFIVAWQGTQLDQRPMDVFTDLGAAPVRSAMWNKMCKDIWVHSSIYAKVQSDFLHFQETIEEEVVKQAMRNPDDTCRIIFTGHSLGGGAALVANMCALAVVDQHPNPEIFNHIELSSVTFAAPMVFFVHNDHAKDEVAKAVVNEIKERFKCHSINFICDKDVVPRLPGFPTFYKPAILRMVKDAANEELHRALDVPNSDTFKKQVDFLETRFTNMFLDPSTLKATFDELCKYSHFSEIQYWKMAGTNLQLAKDGNVLLAQEGFTENIDEDFKYLLACHSFFPNNVSFKPACG
eukprot:TRINITY_DN40080_c0_g1_i1.p1 TRINITY_DN40080_c0_g1~~TRINITY_DN40080_c0_g1_i1.p1  ORF type:complete len:546 (+),score=122.77 TRINITY_DN40080_c0_g1_i1:67-1704(+)